MKKKDLKVISFKNRADLKAIRVFVIMVEIGSTGSFIDSVYYFDEVRAKDTLSSFLQLGTYQNGYVTSKLVWL